MDPLIWMSLINMGGNALSSLFAPDGQELQSFEGEGARIPGSTYTTLDPRHTLGVAQGNISGMLGTLRDRASQPINLRGATVQQPPVFTGGGLPMPIGVSGTDPALADPSMLSLPGLKFSPFFGGLDYPRDNYGDPDYEPPRPGDGGVPGERPGPDGAPKHVGPVPMSTSPTPSTTPRRRNAVTAATAAPSNVSTHDDLPQAAGAVELLLRSMMA